MITTYKTHSRWTLQHFTAYLQAKRDSSAIENLPINFAIKDSINQMKASYPSSWIPPRSCELKMPLGFLTKDTLYASYNYPFKLFLNLAGNQILLTLFVALLLIFCVISLFHTLRWEKRTGKYREVFVHNIVHDLKRPIETELKTSSRTLQNSFPRTKNLTGKEHYRVE